MPGNRRPVKLAMLMILASLLLLSYGACADNSTDMLSLLDFREAINDPKGALQGWSSSVPHCQWMGVRCSLKHPGRVTALNLTGQGLSAGSIPVSVSNLTFLGTLDLSFNSFYGQVPHYFNSLQRLQVLKLNNNFLDGFIPESLTNCSNLEELHLYFNSLKGEIPRQIGLLTDLVFLGLDGNNLTGVIPRSLDNITHLDQIYLESNQIGGYIPDELSQFSDITALGLGDNRLLGSIPPNLYNLSSLQFLDIGANQLGGTLPTNMGDRLANLQLLNMSYNMLQGTIPASLGNVSMLLGLVLKVNNFTGQIPISFGKLSNMYVLDLEANKLEANDSESWAFLHALGNCTSLELLSLARNDLQGVIPDSIGKLPINLEFLKLGGNKLYGIVPPSIGNLSGLTHLTLDNNSLTGPIIS